jgi:hypothetical protein
MPPSRQRGQQGRRSSTCPSARPTCRPPERRSTLSRCVWGGGGGGGGGQQPAAGQTHLPARLTCLSCCWGMSRTRVIHAHGRGCSHSTAPALMPRSCSAAGGRGRPGHLQVLPQKRPAAAAGRSMRLVQAQLRHGAGPGKVRGACQHPARLARGRAVAQARHCLPGRWTPLSSSSQPPAAQQHVRRPTGVLAGGGGRRAEDGGPSDPAPSRCLGAPSSSLRAARPGLARPPACREALCLVGSQEGLAHLLMAVADPGEGLLMMDVAYPSYFGAGG